MTFVTTLTSVAIMVALAVPGFILRKMKMLPEKAVATLVVVLIYVSQPFLTIDSFLSKDFSPSLLINMLITLGLSLVLHIAVFFIAKLVFSFFRVKRKENESDEDYQKRVELNAGQKRIAVITSFMGNIGFMGIPVMKLLFPGNAEMLIYTAVFMVGFNVASWTLGVYTVTGDAKNISLRRAFFNPAVFALVVAIPLFVLKKYIPVSLLTPLDQGIGFLADMTLPLSMLILGIRLADVKVVELFSEVKIYFVCVMKLLVAPLLSLGVVLLLRLIFPSLDENVMTTVFIAMAMPSAALTLSFAEKFDGERNSAVRATLITTLLSIVTIAVLMLLTPLI